MNASAALVRAGYTDRIAFVVELAKRLHIYGTTAQRLEGAVSAVAQRLGLRCNPWSNPTGMILSFSEATIDTPLYDSTQVIRLEPGGTDLRKLCAADAIAEDVMAGRSDLHVGADALHALDRPPGRRALALETFCYGLSAASVAGLLRNNWTDILVSGLIGVLIGALHIAGLRRPRLQEAEEAIAAFAATLLAAAVAAFLVPLTTKTVVIAAIIVLMPGMMLTNAVSELSSQHLVSGTARFGGALAVLLKLTFGTVAAMQLVRVLGWHPHEALEHRGPRWLEWASLLVSSYAFAVLFRAHRRDYLLVMASAALGYGVTRWAGAELGNDAGVFFGSMVVSAASNAYARWTNRPGALVRVPGIVLLVPGSVSFRSLTFVLERDLILGLNTAVAVLTVLVALVAGVLFGNLLVPARRNL
ncbi:MAG TPA: threonine/serine exporter family protein [Xanthomonadaceae bacterium]|jgi:uncharacterized membrane protein YjjP (DUF1212 family)|nr:threonine/serine exporter family protein [Xanthomonadaceae bacterium]